MELKLQPHTKNQYTRGAILIKKASPKEWLQQIEQMGLDLSVLKAYPVPSLVPNELYGCLLVFEKECPKIDIGPNNYCQIVENRLFIPEYSQLVPQLTAEEWAKNFDTKSHIFHPDFGLVQLTEPIDWTEILSEITATVATITKPSKAIFIPKSITSLRLELEPETILDNIENPFGEQEKIEKLPFNIQKLMKGNQKEMDKFLAYMEKNPELAMQYAIPLDSLNSNRGGNDAIYKFGGTNSILTRIKNGWRNLFYRTSKSTGSSDVNPGKYIFIILIIVRVLYAFLSKSFTDYTAFIILLILGLVILYFIFYANTTAVTTTATATGGNVLLETAQYDRLHSQYEKLANDFVDKKQYEKASHVYLKLLKDNQKAAFVLEQGQRYPEAAAIYLKYAKNKPKAAECYEKGKVYKEAINLYKDLNEFEKVGDLYQLTHQKQEANNYYNRVIEEYQTKFQFVKASLVYKNKIKDSSQAQKLLLEGWKTNKDASNCLNNYFENIEDETVLKKEIDHIYQHHTTETAKEPFLHSLKIIFSKKEPLQSQTKNIAYEIIAEKMASKPELASELIHFNKKDQSISKDILKYKLNRKNEG